MGWSNALNKSFFEIWREVVVVTAQIFFKCFGNNLFYAEVIEVVVEGGLIGVVVKSWGKSFLGKPRNYDVYVRSWNIIQNYDEEDIERYMVRHKELTKEELEYQRNALKD